MEVTSIDEFLKEVEAVAALGGSTSAMACAAGLRSSCRKEGAAALWGAATTKMQR